MSDAQFSWKSRGAAAEIVVPGQHGDRTQGTGITVERLNPALATIIAGKGRAAEVSRVLFEFAGVAPQPSAKFVRGKCDLVWSGPGQWLVAATNADAIVTLTMKLAGMAAVTDQTDARAVFRLSGARVRDVLAKGCTLDLHPRAFKAGDAALTSISHIGVQIWQIDDAPVFDITVPRSTVESFWSWFDASAAEFGYIVR